MEHAAPLTVPLLQNLIGAVELIVASIALKAGVFTIANGAHPILSHLFSARVITAVATTLLTPVLLRWVLRPATGPSKR